MQPMKQHGYGFQCGMVCLMQEPKMTLPASYLLPFSYSNFVRHAMSIMYEVGEVQKGATRVHPLWSGRPLTIMRMASMSHKRPNPPPKYDEKKKKSIFSSSCKSSMKKKKEKIKQSSQDFSHQSRTLVNPRRSIRGRNGQR